MGILRGEDLASAYASADSFVFPSTTETLGMVMLEAHAAGLPVIAADSAAARDLVCDGVDGLRYDPRDPDGLRTAVRRIASDPDMACRMPQAARAAVAGASWAEATRVLRGYYEAVLAGEPVETAGPADPMRASSRPEQAPHRADDQVAAPSTVAQARHPEEPAAPAALDDSRPLVG
jgi:hypothetical protein